ncbi:TIGR01620 family protein [Kangiella sp.]|uniref:YcjF family protein n=1 Tax=Kangiella sp. TaxID=1920245 RepID=UPI0019852575|nr:TIGR01620 family protein [Kangiella sp.]MBD3654430.1 TIGR01620 family protein [Kangiella sp.]
MKDKPVKIRTKTANVQVEKVSANVFEEHNGQSLEVGRSKAGGALSSTAGPKMLNSKPKKGLRKLFWPALFTFVAGAAAYESYLFIDSLFAFNTVLGVAATAVAGLAVISGGAGLIKGWLSRRKLRSRKEKQQAFGLLIEENTYGEGQQLIDEVNTEIGQYLDLSGPLSTYRGQKQQVHNDRELIQLYSQTVLEGLDSMALEAITKHATESAVMVALSPLAAADMALVAWRSSKMLQEVSRIYGCPQTTLGRIGLTKQVMTNMMLAGASDMLADAGTELLGKGLAATVSTKVAQGIGVGLLIARMGIQTMKLCRPVEFTDDNRPKLSYIRKSLYNRLTTLLKKSEPSKGATITKGEQDDRD